MSKNTLDIVLYSEKGKSKESHLVIQNQQIRVEGFIN